MLINVCFSKYTFQFYDRNKPKKKEENTNIIQVTPGLQYDPKRCYSPLVLYYLWWKITS